jgi:hypothetical protein
MSSKCNKKLLYSSEEKNVNLRLDNDLKDKYTQKRP